LLLELSEAAGRSETNARFSRQRRERMSEEDELRVLRECIGGDWRGFDLLVERYRGLVWSAVDSVLCSAQDSDEVCHEVFIHVYRKLHSFRFRSSFATWLWRLARNYALQHLRSRKRRSALPLSQLGIRTGRADNVAERGELQPLGRGERAADFDPQSRYLEEARGQMLEQILRRLSPQHREVLSLYYMRELSYEEIALTTGIALNTVRTRLMRARERLKMEALRLGWRES
jgi:RNA polymerase sigma-70 factor (ECF subfamily)